jgi:hypothetical protein
LIVLSGQIGSLLSTRSQKKESSDYFPIVSDAVVIAIKKKTRDRYLKESSFCVQRSIHGKT